MIEIYKKKSLPNLDLIESYGLLAVKIAQHYALRVDFLPEENCRELSKLFRNNKRQL
jgi:ubiquinone biosynthesis protein